MLLTVERQVKDWDLGLSSSLLTTAQLSSWGATHLDLVVGGGEELNT
jgi:hypothetical protein